MMIGLCHSTLADLGVQVHPITGSIAGQTFAENFFSWKSIRWINRKENVQG
jgi:hypothetical protein